MPSRPLSQRNGGCGKSGQFDPSARAEWAARNREEIMKVLGLFHQHFPLEKVRVFATSSAFDIAQLGDVAFLRSAYAEIAAYYAFNQENGFIDDATLLKATHGGMVQERPGHLGHTPFWCQQCQQNAENRQKVIVMVKRRFLLAEDDTQQIELFLKDKVY
jgi:hypothetical protein